MKKQAKSVKGKKAKAAAPPTKKVAKGQKARWSVDVGPASVAGLGSWEGMRINSRESPTVGLAEYAENVQVKMPRVRKSRGAVDTWTGTERLAEISTGSTPPVEGNLLARLLLNPSVFQTTRLYDLAQLYQRYKFKKADIYYIADANATQSGSVIGFVDYDVDNLLESDDPLNAQKAAAHFGQRPSKIWQHQKFYLGQIDRFTNLFTDPEGGQEDRLVFQAVWYLIASTELPGNSALGTIYIDYEIDLSIQSLRLVDNSQYLRALYMPASATFGTLAKPFGTGEIVKTNEQSEASYGVFPPGSEDDEFDLFYDGTTTNGTWTIENLRPGYYGMNVRAASNGNVVTGTFAGGLNFSGTLIVDSGNGTFMSNFQNQVATQSFAQATSITTSSGFASMRSVGTLRKEGFGPLVFRFFMNPNAGAEDDWVRPVLEFAFLQDLSEGKFKSVERKRSPVRPGWDATLRRFGPGNRCLVSQKSRRSRPTPAVYVPPVQRTEQKIDNPTKNLDKTTQVCSPPPLEEALTASPHGPCTVCRECP